MKRLLLFALLCSCRPGGDATGPAVIDARLGLAAGLVQPLEVDLARAAPLEIAYWTEGGPRLTVRSEASAAHSVALTRLRSASLYRYEILGTDVAGAFRTDPLPADLAEIRFAATGTPSVALALVHVTTDTGFHGYVIVDAAGAVVWYLRTPDFPFGVTRRANGNLVYMDRVQGLREVTALGHVVAALPQDAAAREMHHDVIATPANTLLFLAFDTRTVEGRLLKGEAIWEWWPESGRTEKRWSSWDFLSPERDRGPRFGQEWMHANSLAIGPRGNVLVSVHYFNQVLSIAPGWQGLEWRLGGVNATIPVPAEASFSGQHTAAEIAPGRLLVFDNGVDRGGYSRALELELDGAGARAAWQWRAVPDNFAAAVGAARRLPNGNTLVTFGMRDGLQGSHGGTEVYEVDPLGAPVWRLRVTGPSVMFRAEPLAAVGTEGR